MRVKILLLSVLSNFDNFSINAREINTLKTKDYDLIKILILIIYYINDIKLKSIDLIKILRFFFKNNIKEIYKASLRRLNRYFKIFLLL